MRQFFLKRLSNPRCIPTPLFPKPTNFRDPSCHFNFSTHSHNEFNSSEKTKTALVLGSSGCLGKTVTDHLGKYLDMQVIGADVVNLDNGDKDSSSSSSLDAFVPIPTWEQHPGVGDVTEALVRGLCDVLDEDEEIDVIICASGGWEGDPELSNAHTTNQEEYIAEAKAYGNTIDKMMEKNLFPVLASGYAADRFMAEEGLFVVIGATAALSPTPGMMGYGLSKVGAHHFVQTMGEISGKSLTTKSRRRKARSLRKDKEYLDTLSIVGILPTTLDTPSNRNAMPHADFTQWTKPQDIANEIGKWIQMPPLRPHSGALVKVFPTTTKTGSGSSGASFNVVR